MKKIIAKLIQSRWLCLSTILVVLLPFALMPFVSQSKEIQHALFQANAWVKSHHILILLWHILIIGAIYYGWELSVERMAKKLDQQGLLEKSDRIKRLKIFRWPLIGFVLLIGIVAGVY